MKNLLIAILVVLAGCSGRVVTYDSGACKEHRCNGVPIYVLAEKTTTYRYDRILGKDGDIVRISGDRNGNSCNQVEVTEQKLVPSEQKYLGYEPGIFETSKFNVDLNANGTVSKVGVESTPAVKETAEAIAALVTSYRTLHPLEAKSAGNTDPDCTAKAGN